MRISITGMLVLGVAGCGPAGDTGGEQGSTATDAAQTRAAAERGGTITIGEQSWTIVASTQCSVYPGNIVNIAGHAAEDPGLEIVIDYGGPTGARVGDDGSADRWQAIRDTLEIEIDGRRVRGRAGFRQGFAAGGEAVPGSFDVNCG